MVTGVCGRSGQNAALLAAQEHRTDTESAIIQLHSTEVITALESPLRRSCVRVFHCVLWTASGKSGPSGRIAH